MYTTSNSAERWTGRPLAGLRAPTRPFPPTAARSPSSPRPRRSFPVVPMASQTCLFAIAQRGVPAGLRWGRPERKATAPVAKPRCRRMDAMWPSSRRRQISLAVSHSVDQPRGRFGVEPSCERLGLGVCLQVDRVGGGAETLSGHAPTGSSAPRLRVRGVAKTDGLPRRCGSVRRSVCGAG